MQDDLITDVGLISLMIVTVLGFVIAAGVAVSACAAGGTAVGITHVMDAQTGDCIRIEWGPNPVARRVVQTECR